MRSNEAQRVRKLTLLRYFYVKLSNVNMDTDKKGTLYLAMFKNVFFSQQCYNLASKSLPSLFKLLNSLLRPNQISAIDENL